jgi:hypothetical protein
MKEEGKQNSEEAIQSRDHSTSHPINPYVPLSSFILHPSPFTLHPSPFLPHPFLFARHSPLPFSGAKCPVYLRFHNPLQFNQLWLLDVLGSLSRRDKVPDFSGNEITFKTLYL